MSGSCSKCPCRRCRTFWISLLATQLSHAASGPLWLSSKGPAPLRSTSISLLMSGRGVRQYRKVLKVSSKVPGPASWSLLLRQPLTPGSSGKGLLPGKVPVLSAKVGEELPGWLSAVSAEELLSCWWPVPTEASSGSRSDSTCTAVLGLEQRREQALSTTEQMGRRQKQGPPPSCHCVRRPPHSVPLCPLGEWYALKIPLKFISTLGGAGFGTKGSGTKKS